ncbi:MAG: zinc ribbon domain-containing protein [Micrococcaceae bacterium]
MDNCINCNANLKLGAKFCVNCGTAVGNQVINANVNHKTNSNINGPLYDQQVANTPNGVTHVVVQNQIEVKQKNTVGFFGFILALVGLFFGWIPLLGPVCYFLGWVLSIIGLFRKPRGFAITGLIISSVDIILFALILGRIFAAFSH